MNDINNFINWGVYGIEELLAIDPSGGCCFFAMHWKGSDEYTFKKRQPFSQYWLSGIDSLGSYLVFLM